MGSKASFLCLQYSAEGASYESNGLMLQAATEGPISLVFDAVILFAAAHPLRLSSLYRPFPVIVVQSGSALITTMKEQKELGIYWVYKN